MLTRYLERQATTLTTSLMRYEWLLDRITGGVPRRTMA